MRSHGTQPTRAWTRGSPRSLGPLRPEITGSRFWASQMTLDNAEELRTKWGPQGRLSQSQGRREERGNGARGRGVVPPGVRVLDTVPCRVFYWVSETSLIQPKQVAFHGPPHMYEHMHIYTVKNGGADARALD